jgi:hypothetical protein
MGWDMVPTSSGHSKRGDGAPEEGKPPFREEVIVGEDNIVGSTYIYTYIIIPLYTRKKQE